MAWIADDQIIVNTDRLNSVARIDSGSNYYLIMVYSDGNEQQFLHGTDSGARDRMYEHCMRVLRPITESESTQHTTIL